jgi:hypothetical protein
MRIFKIMARRLIDLDEIGEFVKKNYPEMSTLECASALGVSISTISKAARLKGIQLSHRSARKHNIHTEKFAHLCEPELAYFLGYFFADGTVNKKTKNCQMMIATEDYGEIKHIFNKIGKVSIYALQRKSHHKPMTHIFFSDVEFGEFALTKGLKGDSFEKVLTLIPDNLRHYFWRGLIDGDGCFFVNRTSSRLTISSTLDFDWTSFQELCRNMSITFRMIYRTEPRNTGSQLEIARRDDVIKMGQYIYQSHPTDNIGLPRKFNKFLQIINLAIRNMEKEYFKCIYWGKKPYLALNNKGFKREFIGPFETPEDAVKAREDYFKKNLPERPELLIVDRLKDCKKYITLVSSAI